MKWTPLGPRAALVEFTEPDPVTTRARARAIHRLLESIDGFADFSMAFDKVLLEFHDPVDHARQSVAWMEKFATLAPVDGSESRLHEIPVRYDGPDLAEVAGRCGMSVADVVLLHSTPIYDVALLGFSPGFPYLDGLDARLHAPRRANPRPRVPVGAVAIGGGHTGIYSVESPGGWNLIGSTDVRIFDPARTAPDEHSMFLLRTGDRVKFVPSD